MMKARDDETRVEHKTREPEMKLWMLRPVDEQAPPFHFAGVPGTIMVAAADEKQARHMAAAWAGGQSMLPLAPDGVAASAWERPDMATCEEFAPREAGVIVGA